LSLRQLGERSRLLTLLLLGAAVEGFGEKLRHPARYDDELIVRSRVLELRSRAISFAYEVLRASDKILLAEGETRHIVMNSRGRARAFPPEFVSKLRGPKLRR